MIVKKMGVGYDNGRYALNSYKTIISGTATGLRISSVNGTAFLDNCPADILAAVGAQIKIYDSSSRYLQGVIDSVGSSEVLGNELLTSWTNWPPFPYETFTINGTDITSAINTTTIGAADCLLSTPYSFNALFKASYNYTLNSGANPQYFGLGTHNSMEAKDPFVVTAGSQSKYRTTTYVLTGVTPNIVIRHGSATNFSMTGISIKQVTAPSANGVVIKDLSGNQNFISKDASFTYNAASYSYKIWN